MTTTSVCLTIPDLGIKTTTIGNDGRIVGYTLTGKNDPASLTNKELVSVTNDIAANQLRVGTSFRAIESGGLTTGNVLVVTTNGVQFQPAPGDGGTATSLTSSGVIYPIVDAVPPANGEVLTKTALGLEFLPTGGGGAASQIIVNGVTYTITDAMAPDAGDVLTFNGASMNFQPPDTIASATKDVSANQLFISGTSYDITGGVPLNNQYLKFNAGSFSAATLNLIANNSNLIGANIIVVDGTQFPISTPGIPAEGSVLTRVGPNMEFIVPGTGNSADALIINSVLNPIENASTPATGTVLKKTATGVEFGPDYAIGISTSSSVVTVNLSPAPGGEGFVLSTTSTSNAIWTRSPLQDIRINYIGTVNTASASGTSAMAFGEGTLASGGYSIAFGNGAQATILNSIALGRGTTANVSGAVVIGHTGANVFPIFGIDTTSGTKLVNAADDTAAAGAGVPLGSLYHNGGVVRVRVV